MLKIVFRKPILAVLLVMAIALQPALQTRCMAQSAASHRDSLRMEWWSNARFGMFIHWGIYSVPAHNEWYLNNGHVPLATYEKYAKEFDPVDFNADTWVKIAKAAGMKYLVITSKHHDGFCMFNTKATDYNVVKATPWHKDPLKALSAACRKYGIHFGVYYSIMDWHSPYQEASDPNPEHPTYNPTHFKPGEKQAYIDYMKTELKELVTRYHPQILWFDGQWMDGWTDADGRGIYDYLRKMDPKLIINNRVKGAGDYETPEQQIPPNGLPGHYWETCMTINGSWGFDSSDHDFKSAESLIRNLVDIASKGGNYLLNVGPTDKGVIPAPEVSRLDSMGAWLKVNGGAIYGTSASPFTTQLPWGRCTQNGRKLFLEVFDWPSDGRLVLHGVSNIPEKAYLLSNKKRSGLNVTRKGDALVIDVPKREPDRICTVVALDFATAAEVYNQPVIRPEMRYFVGSAAVSISQKKGSVVRYTVDGNEPTSSSPIYSQPLTLENSTTVKAKYFRGDRPLSGTSTATFEKTRPLPAISLEDASNGIEYKYFRGSWNEAPDFAALTPVRQAVLPEITLPADRDPVNYGMTFFGYINVPVDGVYTFYTSSDDGSMLYIGDSLVVNNDGLHGATEEQGVIGLAKGFHAIRVDYFQAQGGDGLQVEYAGPGIEKQNIPASALFFKK